MASKSPFQEVFVEIPKVTQPGFEPGTTPNHGGVPTELSIRS